MAQVVEKDDLTIDELRAAFQALSKGEILKLQKSAKYYSRKCNADPDELINEGICRALAGKRRCRRNLAPLVFLIGIVKSLASDLYRGGASDPLAHPVTADVLDSAEPLAANPADAQNPEDRLAKIEDENLAAAVVAELEELFNDDEVVLFILMGELDELPAEEIRELAGMDRKTYDTARRRMRRKIDRDYPKGWRR